MQTSLVKITRTGMVEWSQYMRAVLHAHLTIVQVGITKAQLQQLQSADLPVTVVICLAQQLVR